MTDYKDLKIEPTTRDILRDAAVEQYGTEHRAISRAGHEAVVAWLATQTDRDVRQAALVDHDFANLEALVDYLADGRFRNDPLFNPAIDIAVQNRHPDHSEPQTDD